MLGRVLRLLLNMAGIVYKNDKESIMKVLELKPEGYLLKSMEPQKIIQAVDAFFDKQKSIE